METIEFLDGRAPTADKHAVASIGGYFADYCFTHHRRLTFVVLVIVVCIPGLAGRLAKRFGYGVRAGCHRRCA